MVGGTSRRRLTYLCPPPLCFWRVFLGNQQVSVFNHSRVLFSLDQFRIDEESTHIQFRISEELDPILASLRDPGITQTYPEGSPGIPPGCPRSCSVEIDSESTQNRPRNDSESAQILPRTIMNRPGESPGRFPGWSPVSPDIHRGIPRVFYFLRVLPEVSPGVPQAPRNRTIFEK